MMKGIQWIIERFVERSIPLVGNLFSATLQSMHALGVAEHQSDLEEAARRYEAEGKPEIAAALRRRGQQIGSDNPAEEAVRIAQQVAQPLQSFLPDGNKKPASVNSLPGLSKPRAKPKPKRRGTTPVVPLNLQDNSSDDRADRGLPYQIW